MSDTWSVVINANHLQLSAVNPPDARVPGPVIGPASRVRPCDESSSSSHLGVVCLDVEIDGRIERGYTIRRMLLLDSDPAPSARISPLVVATPMALMLVAAIIFVFA